MIPMFFHSTALAFGEGCSRYIFGVIDLIHRCTSEKVSLCFILQCLPGYKLENHGVAIHFDQSFLSTVTRLDAKENPVT